MEAEMDLDELAGYMRTWSAVTRYREAQGQDPVAPLIDALTPVWGTAETRRPVRWPLAILAARV